MNNHIISIHALLAESDRYKQNRLQCNFNFYPRSPCGERLLLLLILAGVNLISIHALLAESDINKNAAMGKPTLISIHALLAESDDTQNYLMPCKCLFLSTLSLRRATGIPVVFLGDDSISIHALLAESDTVFMVVGFNRIKFLSTLSLRRATKRQSPTRRNTPYFYPRSPCGERHNRFGRPIDVQLFLSTLSLRRATAIDKWDKNGFYNFYPRSPCGERRAKLNIRQIQKIISIHALLAESDQEWRGRQQ